MRAVGKSNAVMLGRLALIAHNQEVQATVRLLLEKLEIVAINIHCNDATIVFAL